MPNKIPGTAANSVTNEIPTETLKRSGKNWSQFEREFIRCIKEDYPCIYKASGSDKRLVQYKMAWEQLKFHLAVDYDDVTVTYLKTRWKNLRDRYYRLRKGTEKYNTSEYNKYLDGTLSFLDNEIFLEDDSDTVNLNDDADANVSQVNKNANTEVKIPSVNTDFKIRELIHEELDITDVNVKEELDADDNSYMETLKAMIHPANVKTEEDEVNTEEDEPPTRENEGKFLNIHPTNVETEEEDVNVEDDEPTEKEKEEKLLNATRLTQEMIDELILIKTKKYNIHNLT